VVEDAGDCRLDLKELFSEEEVEAMMIQEKEE